MIKIEIMQKDYRASKGARYERSKT